MPHFDLYTLFKWMHVVAMALGGGAAMVILILVGFEESRDDLQGLTSILWKRTVAWAFRIAFLLGIALVIWKAHNGEPVGDYLWLAWKLPLVILLLAFSEMAPKALATRKRGAPLLVFLLFLLVAFVSINQGAFGLRRHAKAPLGPYTGTMEPNR